MRTLVGLTVVALGLIGCGGTSTATPAPSAAPASASPEPVESIPGSTPAPTGGSKTCRPTDQDAYVYHPARLQVLKACIRVTGTIAAVRQERDGDRHILLALDPPFRNLLRPANQGVELGDLVVEPVCVGPVSQADAIATCAGDPDPFKTLPPVGMHVWMEGRYVLDLDHDGWAELHPLYRWARRSG